MVARVILDPNVIELEAAIGYNHCLWSAGTLEARLFALSHLRAKSAMPQVIDVGFLLPCQLAMLPRTMGGRGKPPQ